LFNYVFRPEKTCPGVGVIPDSDATSVEGFHSTNAARLTIGTT